MKIIRQIIVLFLMFFALNSYAQVRARLVVSEGPGRKDTIFRLTDGSQQSYLPVTVLKGRKEGPVFSMIAGIHGYEYPPIVALQELLKEIDINQLKGTLIVVPIANVEAFYNRTLFVNPLDGKNLNNAFPGAASGTITEQLAHCISNEIIDQTDFFLDIHGGDASEDLLPFVCYYDRKDIPEKTAQAKELSEKSGFDYVVSYPYTIGATEPAKYAFKQATQKGITALSIEAGKLGTVQPENVAVIKKAVYNMLIQLNMYEGKIKPVSSHKTPVYLNNQTYVKVPQKGIFYSEFKSGGKVKNGQILGYITDEFGNKLTEIVAPTSGIILYKVGTPPVNKDETLFCIGYNGG
ncbi:succinylglutamate desuccinylase/aspartoacylase family protein [Olivibacter domesticus]|uniref:Succinylglutamate desuccinylase/Aspartoacylase catalytic domain-containing protein n=1 Tax=Olivibacter domesticus TaxID=407022 RepID=A0A1H7R5I1_OLID1|nr:succinylglutamate desuccinylase/aspartoacylase family protein [Olivibacter domesticus]SEL54787.1 hypothetical protein SAMN05661044_02825 [Olivibacter domesticus]